MTTDERLDIIADKVDKLVDTTASLQKLAKEVLDAIGDLADVVLDHERRVRKLEGRPPL